MWIDLAKAKRRLEGKKGIEVANTTCALSGSISGAESHLKSDFACAGLVCTTLDCKIKPCSVCKGVRKVVYPADRQHIRKE